MSDISDTRARYLPVYDNNNRITALVDILFAATDSVLVFDGIVGTPQHYPGEWIVRVPEGTQRIKIIHPGCKPLDFKFPQKLIPESARTYIMDLSFEYAAKWRTMVVSTFSYNKSQYSYGMMLGGCNNNGGYVHVKTDFTFGLKTNIDCDANGMVSGVKGWFTGETATSRLAITIGYMRRLIDLSINSSLFAYLGGGYGERTLAWQMYGASGNYEYARVEPYSFKGYEAETGIVLRLGLFSISTGFQTNQFKYYEANVGIGLML